MLRAILALTALALFTPALLAFDAPARDHDIVPEDYFDIGTVFSCEISTGGQYAAYMESRWGRGKEGRKNDLWVVDLSTRERRRLTFDGFGPGHITWDAGDRWIYFTGRSKRGGETKPPHDGSTQVWRMAPDGTEPLPVTRVKKGVRTFALSSDGRTLYYTTSKEVYADEWKGLRKQFSDLEYGHGISKLNPIWKLDLTSWRTEKVREADRVIHEMTLSPDDGKLALVTTTDNEVIFKEGWSDVDIVDVATGEIDRVTPPGWRAKHPSPYGWIGDLAWAGDGKALAFSLAFDGYATELCVVEWTGGAAALRTLDRPHPIALDGNVTWRGTGRTLCYRGEDQARVRVYAVDGVTNGGQGETATLTPGDVAVGAFSFDGSGERLAVVVETVDRLNDIFLVEGEKSERITDLNPQVATWRMPQISVFSWTGADGDQVDGILELPPGYKKEDGPLPLIVELHGGPTACTKLRLRLWIYGRALMAAKGYALISPNYHGSTGYGDTFTKKLIGRENDIEVIDIRTGIDALVEAGIADRDRIGVMGWSNGGFLTNAMITAEPDLFKAASSGAGVLDMVIQWSIEDTPGHVINYMEGLPWEKPDHYQAGSPLYKLDRVKTPTIIHVGGADPRVPAAHSRGLYRALHHYLGVPVELVVYPGEAHGLSTHENRLAKMKWDLAWFDKYLLEKE